MKNKQVHLYMILYITCSYKLHYRAAASKCEDEMYTEQNRGKSILTTGAKQAGTDQLCSWVGSYRNLGNKPSSPSLVSTQSGRGREMTRNFDYLRLSSRYFMDC